MIKTIIARLFGRPVHQEQKEHVEKKIAFIDGDQSIPHLLDAYTKHVANTNTETHLIRAINPAAAEPKSLRNISPDINKIYLQGYTAGKEIVDKFIAGYIQKAVADGYTHITVISADYDFIDIFKMAAMIDDRVSHVTFRIVVPTTALGKIRSLPDHISTNIEVVKVKK